MGPLSHQRRPLRGPGSSGRTTRWLSRLTAVLLSASLTGIGFIAAGWVVAARPDLTGWDEVASFVLGGSAGAALGLLISGGIVVRAAPRTVRRSAGVGLLFLVALLWGLWLRVEQEPLADRGPVRPEPTFVAP